MPGRVPDSVTAVHRDRWAVHGPRPHEHARLSTGSTAWWWWWRD